LGGGDWFGYRGWKLTPISFLEFEAGADKFI